MTPASDEISQALQSCDREPIHIPGGIQPHGFLLTLNARGEIAQASTNAAGALGVDAAQLQGSGLVDLLGVNGGALLESGKSLLEGSGSEFLGSVVAANGLKYQAIAHKRNGILLFEFEPMFEAPVMASSNIFHLITSFMAALSPSSSAADVSCTAVREVRRLTSFDRVLIYRFDDEWNGTVIAEDRNEELPSYLDLRFPASDIPVQARELYRLNRLRIIPDAGYIAVPIVPALHPDTSLPLDLTYSVLRSVSPVHVQYMKNMGTGSSMSISILREGALWGLVSCHSKLPRQVPFEIRRACDMIAQILSLQLVAAEHRANADYRVELKSAQTNLLSYMAEQDNFTQGMGGHFEELLACTVSDGAAIVYGGECYTFGLTPDEKSIRDFVTWLGQRSGEEVAFSTDCLGSFYEPAKQFPHLASGAIAMSISSLHDSYLLWFRPEVVQTVQWSGNPHKPVEPGGSGRLSPRNSFEIWKEQVRGRSRPWSTSEIDSALNLRQAIVRIVLRKAEELAQLSGEKLESLGLLAGGIAHDFNNLLTGIMGHAYLAKIVLPLESVAITHLDQVVSASKTAGRLTRQMLAYAGEGRFVLTQVDLSSAVRETLPLIESLLQNLVELRLELAVNLPTVEADLGQIQQLVMNLVINAAEAAGVSGGAVVISTGVTELDHASTAAMLTGFPVSPGRYITLRVQDNGLGMDEVTKAKMFDPFFSTKFTGRGLGLAAVSGIIRGHRGGLTLFSEPGEGADFCIYLPID